ncbi:hypothetical protein BS50DRAFT_335898 [Corynespora cassiicola Philippines]|uniref:Xylanolytic transcriptional activator regulatory domain-containing protein n=1 Tax=Corynespora cassiicola Philippines TaxID=1448308 RepID=A0A2T2NV03_CORCC|nr:hypothetical protein BS50DRAFT_335898 [Corynespora cassiicola Philippines]
MFNGLYSNASGFVDTSSIYDNWSLGPSDPLQHKAEALVTYCYPNPSMLPPGSNEAHGHDALKQILTADNVKHFLEEFKHWQSHWPMIHMPTFNPATANDGLVLAMVCIGAVYSARLGVREVRWLMELARTCVLRSSHIYQLAIHNARDEAPSDDRSSSDIEEIQALVLLQCIFVWHGTQKQRQQGREEFWALANVARRADLLRPVPKDRPSSSVLHQPGPLDGHDINSWSWTAWIEQEKRARALYLIFLIDASLAIFFNIPPQFDVHDIKLPLPADDAAWEARTAEDCAATLGLRGNGAQAKNLSGSRLPKQLGMPEAVKCLYNGNQFPERTTNVYSKFILIHVIHVQIFNIQRQLLAASNISSFGNPSSGTSTPQSRNSWTPTDGTISTGTSGRASPAEGASPQYAHAHQLLRQTMSALELWKKIWDADMNTQYPPHKRRLGFCRDGIHFYFLARLFLRSSRREEWANPADIRCQQVFHLLKQIRAYVASDSAQKGIDIGSVTTVDDNYGAQLADLTLNMALLFTRINPSPTPAE